jgi:hypothetical protein
MKHFEGRKQMSSDRVNAERSGFAGEPTERCVAVLTRDGWKLLASELTGIQHS